MRAPLQTRRGSALPWLHVICLQECRLFLSLSPSFHYLLAQNVFFFCIHSELSNLYMFCFQHLRASLSFSVEVFFFCVCVHCFMSYPCFKSGAVVAALQITCLLTRCTTPALNVAAARVWRCPLLQSISFDPSVFSPARAFLSLLPHLATAQLRFFGQPQGDGGRRERVRWRAVRIAGTWQSLRVNHLAKIIFCRLTTQENTQWARQTAMNTNDSTH